VSGSQLNPTLNTQQATTQVLVSDGGTVVIGGVIQTQNSVAIAQVPCWAAFLSGQPVQTHQREYLNAELIFLSLQRSFRHKNGSLMAPGIVSPGAYFF